MTRAGKGIERYDPTTNNVYLGGRGNVPEDVGITVSKKLFAPRMGIAYRLNESTVIRTGYGLNYDPIPFSRPLRGFYPLTINAQTTASGFATAGTLATGIPPVVGPDLSTGIVSLPGNASERSPWAGEIHRGYIQSWNFTMERKLPLNLISTVGYVGTKSTHLLADRDINAGFPGSGTARLPYNVPGINRTVATNMWDGYLSSNYHSLQVSFTRSFSQGLMLKGAYTFSHAIDYTDDDGWASVGWNYGPAFERNRATAGFDRTHVFQIGWVYELPFGNGKKYLNSGITSKIAGGWQFSGLEAMYTGTPFTVRAADSSLNAPNNWQTADQVKTSVARSGNVGRGSTYYDISAFAAPPLGANRFGSSGRNILRNPGLWNTDVTITRNFAIRESLNLQFRTEFYNLPNTSHFYGPTGTTGDPTSVNISTGNPMTIIGAYGERNIRFAFRLQW
jgi:hypothetical protein